MDIGVDCRFSQGRLQTRRRRVNLPCRWLIPPLVPGGYRFFLGICGWHRLRRKPFRKLSAKHTLLERKVALPSSLFFCPQPVRLLFDYGTEMPYSASA